MGLTRANIVLREAVARASSKLKGFGPDGHPLDMPKDWVARVARPEEAYLEKETRFPLKGYDETIRVKVYNQVAGVLFRKGKVWSASQPYGTVKGKFRGPKGKENALKALLRDSPHAIVRKDWR